MIHCEGLVKIYKTSEVEVVALQGLNLTVEEGEMMAIIGNSGSGKSTLLNILGGLDRPSAGTAVVGDWDLLKMTEAQLVEYKRHTVGFIWQNNGRNLLPYMTALENVETPMMLGGKYDRSYAKQLLEWVGLEHRMHSRLHQLSGGEQQRVAIAISLANRPRLLLADEPTGSVDSETSDRIMDIFRKLNRELAVSVVIVTHDMALANKVDRIVAIRDGLTSTEFVKRNANLDTEVVPGRSEVHEAFVIIDRAGRLQVPREYLEALSIDNRATLEFDGERIVITQPK
ncbi:ABC transporter ATP-binding protein [Paenibacillus urinalis]|uniref:ABC transporter ATP-binding protein n=1 Tax=Paenibacillus urinalis TaxID=521520 RepID=A0AAX3MW38_9BACL|nr:MULTISPECIES: ABC transporter ATP-binding protein [Paenibacillus]WDH81497.1 ABC transporter ATP-binding protein [Paenibacillus urinalis]WDH97544.1 ABC transporter ATP-binding protein [Paenibacillus urinalis]WDI01213.1 ABC transporter ATP-binding protein [Paenibacillus urinalis]GAK39728.1 peptide ABC transporter ATP-binding protein [Paenibacillus sp. TCA20]